MKTNPSHPCSPGRTARFQRLSTGLLAGTLLAFSSLHAQTSTIYGLTADRQVNSAGVLSDTTPMQSGYSGTTGQNAVVVFQLPTLPAGKEFNAASLRLYFAAPSGTPSFNGDLYALGVSSSSTVQSGDYYAGTGDSGAIRLQDNLVIPSAASGSRVSAPADLTDFLNAAYDNGSRAGQYVFFRVSPDVAGLNTYTRYNLYSREYSGGSFYWPSLTYGTADIPPSWVDVPLGGGGYVTGLVSSADGSDIYCRTDVGGVFRWVPGTGGSGRWLSVTDTILPTTTAPRAAGGAMGVESIAVDPNNADNLYITVGGAANYQGLYESTDRGDNWTKINGTFTTAPNGIYRPCGERLAVDPNNSNILWIGTIQNGLIKGVKSGGTWTWTSIPSTDVPYGATSTTDKAGVTFVVCDKNGTSTLVYAGVYDSVGTTGGVYRFDGTTWTKVGGIAVGTPQRAQIAVNGTLFIATPSLVAKLPRNGTLSAISPTTSVSYSGIAVDPNDATGQIVYVSKSTGNADSNIWRSADAGLTWTNQGTNYNNNKSIARAEPDGTPSVTGYAFGKVSSLLVTPGNSNELWCGDYFGVARTQNASQVGGTAVGSQAVWYWLQTGQEESVVETLKVPPSGSELIIGCADLGGYRWLDLAHRPYGSYGHSLSNPYDLANMTSLDYSGGNSNVWARTGTSHTTGAGYGGDGFYGSGATSTDGGATWLAFGEIQRKTVNSGAAGWETWDLTTYLADQKAKGVNTVTLVISSARATNSSSATLTFASLQNTNATLKPFLLLNGSTSVQPSDDATVLGNATSTNVGTDPITGTSFAYGTIANERHIYLKFNLGGVSSVTSAVLNLYRTGPTTAGTAFPVGVYGCANTSWTEGAITWANRPLTYSSYLGQPNQSASYRTAGNANLSGGRVVVSANAPAKMVWMPFGNATVPHYTTDGGVTWTPATGLPAGVNRLTSKSNPSYFLHQLAADRVNGNFYIAHLSSGNGNHTCYRSTDGGATWTAGTGTIGAGTYNTYRTQIVAAPNANDVWFSDDGVDNATNGGVWRSTDGGNTWTRMGGAAGSSTAIRGARQITFGKAPTGSSYLYSVFFSGNLGGVRGIHRSDDYGATWVSLANLPTLNGTESLAGDSQTHGRVLVGTGGRGVIEYQP